MMAFAVCLFEDVVDGVIHVVAYRAKAMLALRDGSISRISNLDDLGTKKCYAGINGASPASSPRVCTFEEVQR